MTDNHKRPLDPTAAAKTVAAGHGPRAYTVELAEDYPATAWDAAVARAGRTRWALSVAALLAAAAAFIAAAAIGVRVLNDANTPIVAVTRATITTRAPALTAPDVDTAFLQDLDAHGVWSLSAYGAVHDAHVVCDAIHAGHLSHDETVAGLTDAHIAGKERTDRAAVETFISIAIEHYCPGVNA